MSPLQENSSQRKLVLCLLLLFIASTLISAAQSQNHHLFRRTRLLLELEDDDSSNDHDHDHEPIIKKSSTNKIPTKNQTKLIKPSSNSSKNQTKLIKPSSNSSKNQTKLSKTSNLAPKNQTKITKTSNIAPKNQTKITKTSSLNELKNQTKLTKSSNQLAPKNQSKLIKSLPSDSSKNKTSKAIKSSSSSTQSMTKSQMKKPSDQPKMKKAQKVVEDDEEEDLVSEFTDLPSRFQETFLPDMERISKTSKIYLNKYNNQFTKGFKPYVGHKYASTLASVISFAFIIIPLILVSLLFSKITAYFSLQKFLIFIQIYLSIYFTILALSSLITGLEPLKFFYATAHSTYVCVQVLQTLAYVLYLLLLLMYLMLVFSTESGAATRLLGLAQMVVGLAVGLHYYITAFHRAVLHQPPRASWKVHALYATSFVLISLLGRLDRRKKAYLEDDGQEGKRS